MSVIQCFLYFQNKSSNLGNLKLKGAFGSAPKTALGAASPRCQPNGGSFVGSAREVLRNVLSQKVSAR